MTPTYLERNLAYAAGLMDGEGFVGIHQANNGKGVTLVVGIAMTDLEPIKWLLEHFGGRSFTQRFEGTHWKPLVKRRRIEVALEFIRLGSGAFHRGDELFMEERAVLYERMAKLNAKGVHSG